jgi:putative ABC transport system permease protein
MKKNNIRSPRILRWVLNNLSDFQEKYSIIGDLEEFFQELHQEKGYIKALYWYTFQCLVAVARYFEYLFLGGLDMIKNYFKTAIRNMFKSKIHAFINIVGLAMGIAIFMLITIYSQHELSYNKFHKKANRIFQFSTDEGFLMLYPLATHIKENLLDYENIVRMDSWFGGGQNPLVVVNDGETKKRLKVKDIRFAEQRFFEMFDFKVVHGDPKTALAEPYSIVLTKSTAQKLFNIENAVGRSIHYIGDRNRTKCDMTVTAIVEEAPSNSTISFNALGSLATLYAEPPNGKNLDQEWRNNFCQTYILLDNHNLKSFEKKANTLWEKQIKVNKPKTLYSKLSLIPITSVPFHQNNNRQFIYFIQMVGIFILSIAIINFVNLTIAKSTSRMKEIGIRKVIGSHRFELIKQFLFEAIITCWLVVPFVVFIMVLSKNQLYRIINKQIPLDFVNQPLLILMVTVGILVIAIIAGTYPALVLSAFKPTSVLKGKISNVKKKFLLKHGLIVFQFVITISLFACMLIISKQVSFLKTKDVGFNHRNIIRFDQSREIKQNYNVFKKRLLQNPNIFSVTRMNYRLANDLVIGSFHEIDGVKKPYSATTVDPDFFSTMGIELLKGRDFSWERSGDLMKTMIVNESFVKAFNLDHPLGAEINFLNRKVRIIGVIKDFHYNSFREVIAPSAFVYANWNSGINIKISDQNVSQAILHIKNVWDELSPEAPFEYEFLDESYDKLYKSEESFQQIVTIFSGIAIMIACLGLLGLVLYNAERRTKEIGIRKVVGASVKQMLILLAKDFTKWILVANIITWPIVYYAMNHWLGNFAYRINIGIKPLVLAGIVTYVLALLTVAFHALKAATANPVKALRHE